MSKKNNVNGCMPCKIKAFFAKFKKSNKVVEADSVEAETAEVKAKATKSCSWWMIWC